MIVGIGTDITAIARIEAMITAHGDRFLGKVYTPAEISYCQRMANPAIHVAGRWAAKEAFYKALPLLIQPHATWKSIQIVAGEGSRRPVVELLNPALSSLFNDSSINRIHLSISHEQAGYCSAFVVLESTEAKTHP